jgi:hypothetical protein
MRPKIMLLALFLVTTGTAVAQDPFVGTWVYNAQKSPKPTITYGIKDLGGDRYALTGSTGETTEIKADGVSIKSPSGATVSFKKVKDHIWQMDRVQGSTMVRTYTVSADDTKLVLLDVFTGPDGSHEKTTTTYTRTGPGKSLFGEWKSISMDEEVSGEQSFTIEPYGKAGISIRSAANKHPTELELDGVPHPDKNSESTKVETTSGTRVNARHIHMEDQVDGKPDSTEEYEVSEDGKTLTMVSTALKTSAKFTSVWDKK